MKVNAPSSSQTVKKALGEQTLRQIRQAATLLEKSLPAGSPM
jgi:hypothetical protein